MGKFDTMKRAINRKHSVNSVIANSNEKRPSLLEKPFAKNKRLQKERIVSKLRFRRRELLQTKRIAIKFIVVHQLEDKKLELCQPIEC